MAELFESRFCRFEVPSGATVLPGAGVLESRADDLRKSAVIVENWLDEKLSAARFAEIQRKAVLAQTDAAELSEEGAVKGGRFPDAHQQVFEIASPEGVALRQEQYFMVEGPLAVCLTLTGPAADASGWRRFFEPVQRSFEIPFAAELRALTRAPLLSEGVSGPAGGPAAARAVGHLQVSFPVPAGWTYDEATSTLRSGGGADIRIQRSGLPASTFEMLFAEAIGRALRDEKRVLLRWDRGATAGGREAAAIESEAAPGGTWVKTEKRIVREIFLEDDGALALTLEAAARDDAARAALAQIVAGTALLPAEARRLRVALPWLPVELEGPWRETGPGIFVRTAPPPMLLSAQRQPSAPDARKLADLAAASLRSSPELAQVSKEEARQEDYAGRPVYRYSLDFVTKAGEKAYLRAVWFDAGGSVCSVLLRGADPSTGEVFRKCLESLRPAAARVGA